MLMFNSSFGQIGAFNVTNNTDCAYTARVHAFEGSCNDLANCTAVDNTGWVSLPANTTTDIAASFSGTGDTWGWVEIDDGTNITSDGDAACFSRTSLVGCTPDAFTVSWGACHNAQIP